MTRTFTIAPDGEFSLAEAGRFGFGQRVDPERSARHGVARREEPATGGGQRRPAPSAERPVDAGWDGTLRLAFCLDGYERQVGVEVTQDASGRVHGVVHGGGGLAAIQAQVARVLSLDHDGGGFAAVGRADPVIGRLQAAAPGLRPPLFYSPYEAAVWGVLASRRPAAQMAEVRRRLSEQYGAVFDLAGRRTAALPTPRQLLAVPAFPGLTTQKVDWMHGVARAALAGALDVAAIQGTDPDSAMARLREIKGIGAFYSSLIVIRAAGLADVLPVAEPRLRALVTDLYGLPGPPTNEDFRALAEPWRPYRTWASVLIRAAAHRLPPAQAA
jgi:DNA-3-methyladenine glycosylase II